MILFPRKKNFEISSQTGFFSRILTADFGILGYSFLSFDFEFMVLGLWTKSPHGLFRAQLLQTWRDWTLDMKSDFGLKVPDLGHMGVTKGQRKLIVVGVN